MVTIEPIYKSKRDAQFFVAQQSERGQAVVVLTRPGGRPDEWVMASIVVHAADAGEMSIASPIEERMTVKGSLERAQDEARQHNASHLLIVEE